jgi:hypothetical protein
VAVDGKVKWGGIYSSVGQFGIVFVIAVKGLTSVEDSSRQDRHLVPRGRPSEVKSGFLSCGEERSSPGGGPLSNGEHLGVGRA